jgi:hypothetical protein
VSGPPPPPGHRVAAEIDAETAYTGPSPIFDPDLPEEQQPQIRGLALPAEVLQKLYRDNAVGLLARVGASREFG